MKRKLLVCLILVLIIASFSQSRAVISFAEEEKKEDILSQMAGAVSADELNERLDELFVMLGKSGGSFKEKLLSIAKGEFSLGYENVLSAFGSLLFSEISDLAAVFLLIAGLSLAFALIKSLKPQMLESETGGVIKFIFTLLTLGALSVKAVAVFSQAYNSIENLSKQMEAVFPPIITIMSVTGSNLSAGLYRPVFVFLTTFVTGILTKIVFPLIFFSMIIVTVSDVSETLKTDKIVKFVCSLNKWILGIIATVFTFFVTLKGTGASYSDGISLRIIKFAVGNSVPLVGGFLRESSETVLASGVLIKNALGVCGVMLLAFTLLTPVIKLVVFSLFLKLTAGVSEILGNEKTGAFLSKISSLTNYVLAVELVMGYLYIISFVMLVYSGGAFV